MRWLELIGAALAGALAAAACSSEEGTEPAPYGTAGSSGSAASSGSSAGGQGGAGAGGAGSAGTSGTSLIDAGNLDVVEEDGPCSAVSEKAHRPAVDIVWIVDNSCSMGDEIDKIRTNINTSFVPKIAASTIDWQVIMISRRGSIDQYVCVDPPLGGPLCADNPPRFHQIDCEVGSHDSLFVAGNSYSIVPFPCNPGTPWGQLVRYDATKVFVEVTDDEADPPPFSWDGVTFDGWAMSVQPAGMFGTPTARKYVFHSIIGADPTDLTKTCSSVGVDGGLGNSAEAPGVEYQKLSQVTGGIVRSICEADWSDIFDTIASGIVDKLECEFAVPAPEGGTVDPDKVNVKYTPGDGSPPEDVLRDDNAECVPSDGGPGANGWQWNVDQTKIILCGPICDAVRNDDDGQIDIELGCETKVVPPPT
jgi:hypothetical protein